jgi:preprotein translocase subunit SecA
LVKIINDVYTAKEKELGGEVMREVEKFAYLGAIDRHWIDHIDTIDGLREGVRFGHMGKGIR